MRGTDRSPPVSIAVKLWYGNCCSRDYDPKNTSLCIKIYISILLFICILHKNFIMKVMKKVLLIQDKKHKLD